MADKLIVDCSTGDEVTEPLSADEQAERTAMTQEAEQQRQVEQVQTTNQQTIEDRLDQALASLRAHVDRAKPSTAAAQASAAYDATVLLCRVAIGVIRVMRRRLDATD